MLRKFSVTNFRSFKEKVTLDLSPDDSRAKADHIIHDSLKTTAIFGANSSGKSNLVKAMKCFKGIIVNPDFSTKEQIYCLDGKSDAITTFNLEIQIGGMCYGYLLSVCSSDITVKKGNSQCFTYPVANEELFVADSNDKTKRGYYKWKPIFKENSVENLQNLINWKKSSMCEAEKIRGQIDSYIEEINKINDVLTILRNEKKLLKKQTKYSIGNIDDFSYSEILEKNREIKRYSNRRYRLKTKKDQLNEKFETITDKLNEFPEMCKKFNPVLFTKKHGVKRNKSFVDKHINTLYNWILSTLVILETDDFHLPLDNLGLISDLSKVVSSMDVGIERISWQKIESSEGVDYTETIKKQLGENNYKLLKKTRDFSIASGSFTSKVIPLSSRLFLCTYWIGKETIYEMMVEHSRDSAFMTKLNAESDGTRRIIELASLFIPTYDDRVYIVDELDLRLHPNLTYNILEKFINAGFENKQLIFTTHETRLFTTELFREDELWLVYRIDGTSFLKSVNNLDKEPEKRIDIQYLKDRSFPGISGSHYLLKNDNQVR